MKALIRLLVLGLALAAFRAALWAVEPPPPRSTGKVLVLENGRTMEGDIERHGDQYRIRRAVGEVWVSPTGQAMRLCADWQEAYAFMAARANLFDPDERMRLARWCQLHGLREQALAEVKEALKMRPANPEALQMEAVLVRAVAMGQASRPAQAAPLKTPAPPPLLDISSDSVALFNTRVQPILMNTCVSCHTSGKGGQFHLVRAYEGGQRATTNKNLAAVLAQINPERPELSPLLIKAVSAHGNNGQPPLKSRQAVPYQTLQVWVDHLLRNNPQLRGEQTAARVTVPEPRIVPQYASSSPAGKPEARSVPQIPAESRRGSTPVAEPTFLSQTTSTHEPAIPRPTLATEKASSVAPPSNVPEMHAVTTVKHDAPPETVPAPPQPSPATSFSTQQATPAVDEPVDEFDPVIFNRQTQPKR